MTRYLKFHLGVYPHQLESLAAAIRPHAQLVWWGDARLCLSGLIPEEKKADFEEALAGIADCDPSRLLIERTLLRMQERNPDLTPKEIGGYWLYFDASHKPLAPEGLIPLHLVETAAFGVGNHITTRHCLTAIRQLEALRPNSVLDLGCGTGILSMAVAATWNCDQLATDVDAESLLIAMENLKANGFTHVRTAWADGFNHPEICSGAPYEVILANLLAPIAMQLAPDMPRMLSPKGMAILSGIRTESADAVIGLYESHGLQVVSRCDQSSWTTLIVNRITR